MGNRRSHLPSRAVSWRLSRVDVVYYGNGRNLEYDFEVSAGANPDQIRFDLAGAERLDVNAGGDLVMKTGDGPLIWKKPHVYQVEECGAQREIEARYRRLADGRLWRPWRWRP